ncbi:hypothetical protein QR680_018730 [Steinernema hermaphroditum]|uniref:Uncharacterized protein n=1 Tax=Steinernema hermaphroditum TaxID=289476 RepID=A0AA39HJS1_9BILA|nr:hypothetical protein QR680_018730 [Steinernema hermaphroditum]
MRVFRAVTWTLFGVENSKNDKEDTAALLWTNQAASFREPNGREIRSSKLAVIKKNDQRSFLRRHVSSIP